MKRRPLSKLIKGEKGQILILVLLMMLVGSLIIPPVLAHIRTELWTGKVVFEEKMNLSYAADSGVEDALWQVKNANLDTLFGSYNKYNYTSEYGPHMLTGTINDADVGYTVENVWIPKDVTTPDPTTAQNIIEYGNTTGQGDSKLIITGNPSQTSAVKYQIGIIYYHGSEGTDALRVQNIGVWLSPGFRYAGNCSLANDPDTASYATPNVSNYKSGEAVVWSLNSTMFKVLPGITTPIPNPMVSTITFDFTGPVGQSPSFVSWVTTSGVSSVPYTWDGDKKVYGIESTADHDDQSIEVDAYAMKIEMRQLGSAISGDYVAVGNSLMWPDPSSSTYRSRLLKQSSATVSSGSSEGQIPANATVEAAYLYWSGFIDHYYWFYHASSGPSDPYATGWWFSNNADNATGTRYDANFLSQMFANSKVGTVSFGVSGYMQDVTANQWAVYPKMNDAIPSGEEYCWYYCCLYNATDLIQELIDNHTPGVGSNGSGTYILSHVSGLINQVPPRDTTINFDLTPTITYPSGDPNDHTKYGYAFLLYDTNGNPTSNYTGYPLGTPATKLPGASTYQPNKQFENYDESWTSPNRYSASYAGWSLVIIYSSPETKGHQLYLYDIKNPNFTFAEGFGSSADPDFDGDGLAGGVISGFLVPQPITGEVNAAKLTCFVGEGDFQNTKDYIKIKGPTGSGTKLWDGINVSHSQCSDRNSQACPNNIWNSQSLGFSASGVDIDTPGINPTNGQYITWSCNELKTGDTQAQINLPSPGDGFTLIYIILSFRSTVTTGGTISYLVR